MANQNDLLVSALLDHGDPLDNGGECVYCEAYIVEVGKGEQQLKPHHTNCAWAQLAIANGVLLNRIILPNTANHKKAIPNHCPPPENRF